MQINPAIKTAVLNSDLFSEKKLQVAVARMDWLHPVISGNKYFKLKYNIKNAIAANKTGIITFGGAYSNHLAATAFACNENGLQSTAVVRGEDSGNLSHTLLFCKETGMKLEFVSRTEYSNKEKLYSSFQLKYPCYFLVPEGGDNEAGVKGCTEILSNINNPQQYTHIICDVGTGATFKGIVKSSVPLQTITGIVVLKGAEAMNETFTKSLSTNSNFQLIHDYHFGGYAKRTDELITFMNRFYELHHIPSDFVYTGKLFFGLYDLIHKNFFPPGSKILCIHTGGLQGNLSLPKGLLNF